MSKQAEYSKRCYQKHKARRKAEIKARRSGLLVFVQEYKQSNPCVHCGESDVRCLDFHHKDPATKIGLVSFLARRGVALEKLKEEIGKCEILCANCHRKHHRGPLVQREDTSLAPMGWGFDSPEVHQFYTDKSRASNIEGE